MRTSPRKDRGHLLAVSLLVLPLTLAGCGGGGTTAANTSGGKAPGPTPTSALASVIGKVRSAYGGLANLGQAGLVPAWVTLGANGKSVALLITTSGFAFNGASNGTMTITVPQGWQVSITDRNTTSVAQSLVIATQAKTPLPSSGFAAALTGAATAHAATGQAKGSQQFSFAASRAGNYIMVSDVSGSARAGLWDHFDVSATAKVPAVSLG
jgi:hypothetical protein